MEEARKTFENILRIKGKEIPPFDGKRYENVNIQTYWRWFLTGWTMHEGVAK